MVATGPGHPAGVDRAGQPASTRRRVVLPPPLRPTTPIRSPLPTPSETASSTWVVPRRGSRSRGRRGWPSVESSRRRVRPARWGRDDLGAVDGTLARRTSPHDAGGGEGDGEVERGLGDVDEEGDGRPGAGHDAAERAVLEARDEHLAEVGLQRDRGVLRSLVSAAPSASASPQRSAVIMSAVGDRVRDAGVAAQPVALGIHGRGRQAVVADGEDPVVRAPGQHRREPLAATGAHRGAAGRRRTGCRCRARRPSRGARHGRSPRPQRWSQATRAPAASAEPPAMPAGHRDAPCGSRGAPARRRRTCSASRRAARSARLLPSVGTPSASGPLTTHRPLVGRRPR